MKYRAIRFFLISQFAPSQSTRLARIKRYVLIFLIFLFNTAWSQHKVVLRGVIVDNNYAEYLTNNFSDSAFTARFFENFEISLRKKLGDIMMIYPGGKKITFMDPRLASSSRDAIGPYQDYGRQRSKAKKYDYDYIVEVRMSISDDYKGNNTNIKIVSKVILKDVRGKSVIHRSGIVKATIPPPKFNAGNLLIDQVEFKQNFPLSITEFQNALNNSVNLAFEENNKQIIQAPERPTLHVYDSLVNTGIKYRILAPVNYAKSRFKLKVYGYYSLTRNRPLILYRIGGTKNGFLNFKETRISDIDFGVGVGNIYKAYRFQRNFRIGIEAPDIPNSNYFVRGMMHIDDGFLGVSSLGSVKLAIKRKDEKENGVLHFTNRNLSNNPLSQYNRSLGRVFCPFGKLEGMVSGKQLIVQSSPSCLNALEIFVDGELAGLAAHPVTTRKYLKKKSKMIPFIIYVSPKLSLENESLVLQSFQFNRLSYLLKDYQDQVVDAIRIQK